MIITILGSWPSFNSYIACERANRFLAAKMKKEEMERIAWQLPSEKLQGKINITIHPTYKNKRKDPDSIFFGIKCLLDAMVAKGMIPNDTQQYIGRITIEPPLIGEEKMEIEITS